MSALRLIAARSSEAARPHQKGQRNRHRPTQWSPSRKPSGSERRLFQRRFHGRAQGFEIGRNILHFVIPGRSKERSDAAQALGSMPSPRGSAPADQNRTLPPRSAKKLDPFWIGLLDQSVFHWRSGGYKRRSEPQHSTAEVTEWIPGSALRFASLRLRMTKAWWPVANRQRWRLAAGGRRAANDRPSSLSGSV
jgi:hypothetical protein